MLSQSFINIVFLFQIHSLFRKKKRVILTLGSLATLGVLKAARVATPIRCWAAPRRRRPLEAALPKTMDCILERLDTNELKAIVRVEGKKMEIVL